MVSIVAIAVLAYLFYNSEKTSKEHFLWYETLDKRNTQPYDLDLWYKTLKESWSLKEIDSPTEEQLNELQANSTLFTTDDEIVSDSISTKLVLDYVRRGGTFFFANNSPPYEIMQQLGVPDSLDFYEYHSEDTLTLTFRDSIAPRKGAYDFNYQFEAELDKHSWLSISADAYDKTLKQIGFKRYAFLPDSSVCIAYIPLGKGKIIFHLNPILLSNYYYIQPQGYAHLVNTLALFNTKTIYWVSEPIQHDLPQAFDKSPLRKIYDHPSLSWAWRLALVALLIYLLSQLRRKQKVIPILVPNENTTIEFVRATTQLYFNSNGHHPIARELYGIFMNGIRSRYGIDTNLEKAQLAEAIAKRSGIAITTIDKLLTKFNLAMRENLVTDLELIELQNLIQYFHQHKK